MKDTHEQERKALQESAKKNFIGGLLTLTGGKPENKEVIERLFESMSNLIKVLAKKKKCNNLNTFNGIEQSGFPV